MPENYLRKMLISQLRQLSRRWPPRTYARKRASRRVEVGKFKNGNPKFKTLYQCNKCGKLFEKYEIHVDHILPVIDPKVGFVDWNTFIARLFCNEDNLQILCESCHSNKTADEGDIRHTQKKYVKKTKKKAVKKIARRRRSV